LYRGLFLIFILMSTIAACDNLYQARKYHTSKHPRPPEAQLIAAGHLEKLVERTQIEVSQRPMGLALSPDDRKLFVACALRGYIDVIDTELLSLETRLGPFSDPIYQVLVSSDGRLLFAHGLNGKNVFVIETDTGRTVAEVPVAKNITNVIGIPGTNRVLVGMAEIPTAQILSGATGEIEGEIQFPEPVGYMAVAPGGQLAAASSGLFAFTNQGSEGRGNRVYVFNPQSSGIASTLVTLDPGVFVRKPLFVQGDKVLLVPDQRLNSVDAYEIETSRHLKRIEVGITPERLVMIPGGRTALVFGASEEVAVIDCSKVLRSGWVRLPGQPSDAVVSADGHFFYAALSDQSPGVKNRVAVVDLADFSVRDLIPTGKDPCMMVISRDGRSVYVANFLDNTVSVIK